MYKSQMTYEMKSGYGGHTPHSSITNDKKLNYFSDLEADIESEIDYDSLITEDDEPVDNLFSERQQKLLPDSLYASWNYKKPFLACANVGIYDRIPTTPIVPDVLLSLNVKPAKDIWKKKNRCYMIGVFGKPPELVVEIVSNTVGKERRKKYNTYAKMEIKYYIIFDPDLYLYKTKLHAYELKKNKYVAFSRKKNNQRLWFEDLNLGLTLQKGVYQHMDGEWLRWCNRDGEILKTGEEKAIIEHNYAITQKKRAIHERKRADEERRRAEVAEKEVNRLKAQIASFNI